MADLLVALTGGIASGKSTVAAMLEKLGATVIDSDLVAREVVAVGSEGAEEISNVFGEELFSDGQLNRAKLAEIVFGDPQKRLKLENILHPLIRTRSNYLFEKAEGVVIYQIPLLVESKHDYQFDYVVTVEASEQTRIKRLIETREMNEAEAISRLSSQTSRKAREEIANQVIDSDCSLVELELAVNQLWNDLEEMRKRKLGFS
ncbi:MAG: dephospho-CoA kinase [Microbacteriaceae bacterium]|nr:dephospho-CoA kinase [Microbacteriaceae bacterium]